MSLVHAVIFDMDGVLIDSEPLWEQADDRLILENGGKGSVKGIKAKIMGTNEAEAVRMLHDTFGLRSDVQTLIADRRGFLLEIYEKHLEPRKGLLQLLKELQGAHIKTAIASSTAHVIIEYVIKKIGAGGLFHAIVSGVDVKQGKPAPDIFLKAAEKLGVLPKDCIVLEDAPKGVAAAKAAGIRCVGVLHSRNSPELLKDADLIVTELTEVNLEKLQKL